MLYIGMMSGTSLDGIDAALVEITSLSKGVVLKTVASASQPFSSFLLSELQALQRPCENELHRSFLAANALASAYAKVVGDVLVKANCQADDVVAIGAHGQTIRHRPEHHYSVQLLNGALLAELSGIDTACDFRSADLAAGGEGAPLAPGFHAEVFQHASLNRCIVNIGGIANVTHLHANAMSNATPLVGFDTGPGNTLMDYWCKKHLGQPFDKDGMWAKSATFDLNLLQHCLNDAYFQRSGPKSTGRDLFNADWLEQRLMNTPNLSPNVVQATLLELTATTIAKEINSASVNEVYLCGGGAFNKTLFERLSTLLAPLKLATTSDLGIAPQSVEALAFAWLAYKRITLEPANLPSVTAAKGLRILGALHKASGS
jgi:anhydro-N-acetylmuramic acid kinase